MQNKIAEAARATHTVADSPQVFLEQLAQFCVLAQLPEDELIATIQAAYSTRPSANKAETSAFVDSLGASQALSAWHEHPRFLTADGTPAALSLSRGQFAKLCRASGTNSSADQALELLVKSGAVRRDGDVVTVTRRHLIVGDNQPVGVVRATRMVQALLSTVIHNLNRGTDEPGRFERSVANRRLSAKQVPALLAHLSIHGQSFLEDLDSWMSARESDETPETIGVGVFLFVDSAPGTPSASSLVRSRRKP